MQTHRSFTIRLPIDLYLETASVAQADGLTLNAKLNQLLMLGLGKHISLDAALARLLMKTVTEPVE